MQVTTNAGLPNSPGWYVWHNPNDHLYYLKSTKSGQVQWVSFTNRRMAEKALHDYLVKMVETAPANMKKKNDHQKATT